MPSSQFMAAAGTALNDLILAQVLSAVSGVDINILGADIHPFAGLQSWATGLEADASDAINQANAAVTGVATNSAQIASLQAQQTSSTTGGNSVAESSFPPSLSGTIGSGWSLGGNTGTAPWGTDANGNAGLAGNNSLPTGIRAALATTLMATDQHEATAVVGATGGNAQTTILIHAASDLSSFVYANIFPTVAYIGYGSFNAGTGAWTWNDFISGGSPINLQVGQSWKIAATESGGIFTYALTCNGQPIASKTDSSGLAPSGSSNRCVGFAAQQVAGFFLQVSWLVGGFAAADTVSPSVVGTCAHLYRAATGSVNTSGSGWGTMGAGTFDTIRQLNGLTVANLGTGVLTAQQGSPYVCSFGAQFSSAAAGSVLAPGLGITPSGSSMAPARALWTQTAGTSQAFVDGVAGTGVVYLNPGDSVQPLVYDSSGAIGLVGNGAGSLTYFDVARVG